jgi:uncharacterized protein YkwD
MQAPHMEWARRVACISTLALVAVGLTGVANASAATTTTYVGSPARLTLKQPIVDMTNTPTGAGYWLVASDGGIFSYGDARFYGSTGAIRLKKQIVGMTGTKHGKGYWLVAADGGIFSFGDARFYGSTGAIRLKQPVVGMAATPSGRGYWLVASDGGIFSFGDAHFYGSTGAIRLKQPIVGMATTPSGHGYWMVAADGGIFTFGDAHFYGSTGRMRLLVPIVGMANTSGGKGYWLVAKDGSVYPYGDAHFYGSAAGTLAGQAAVGLASSPNNDGYWIASQWGGVTTATADGVKADPTLVPRSGAGAVANELVTRINAERTRRGLFPLFTDPRLDNYATFWSHVLNGRNALDHQNLGAVINGQPWHQVGENLFYGSGPGAMDAGTAHIGLMGSPGHRANILYPSERLIGIGVACENGRMIVVEDFATPNNVPLAPATTPAATPIAAPNEGGASC